MAYVDVEYVHKRIFGLLIIYINMYVYIYVNRVWSNLSSLYFNFHFKAKFCLMEYEIDLSIGLGLALILLCIVSYDVTFGCI